jgi:hypothetical protein
MMPFTPMQYRIRIFDNYNHLKTVHVKIIGQRFIKIAVDSPLLGEKVYMAFMISPKVKPFIFGGQELEYNFDIREATPMAELSKICPDLITEINEDFNNITSSGDHKTVDAEFSVSEDPKPSIPIPPSQADSPK